MTVMESYEVFERIAVPDLLLPAQAADMRRSALQHPEARLWLAILEDALECYQRQVRPATPPRQVYEVLEAYRWIFMDDSDGSTWYLAFADVCTGLGIEPEYLRRKLAETRPLNRDNLRSYFHDPEWRNARKKPAASKPHRDTKTQMLALAS